jgi:Peptidase family C25
MKPRFLKRSLALAAFWLLALPTARAQSSVLASGLWLKIGITQTGIYRLDASTLQQNGFDLNTLDPRRLRLFGQGGGMRPAANAAPRPTDLPENAIQVVGQEDGRFDVQDFILFYGQGPHTIQRSSVGFPFTHQTHIYADTAYYFLTSSDTPGRRVGERPSIPASATFTTFDDFIFYEKDQINLLSSGRSWYGEVFIGSNEQTLTFEVPGLVEGPVQVGVQWMAAALGSSQFRARLNGQVLGSASFGRIIDGLYNLKGIERYDVFSLPVASATQLRLGLTFERPAGVSGAGYLDFVRLACQRRLQLYGGQTAFRVLASANATEAAFRVENVGTNQRIWDVTTPFSPQNQSFTSNNNTAQFGTNTQGQVREWAVFDPSLVFRPASLEVTENQNLRGMSPPDLLILVSEKFLPAAQRLAAFRRQNDRLEVAVATLPKVYNEFSSGQPDLVALRDFVRFLYQKNPQKLRYLLLFGDASFDYKKRFSSEANIADTYVPVFESPESLDPLASYSSDDFLGFMESNEGDWHDNHTLEIGVGRLPARNLAEAQTLVDKLVRYTQRQGTGAWRNRLAMVADNGDFNIHQKDADELAQNVERDSPTTRVQRIFVDAFPQVATATGLKAPACNSAIQKVMNDGALILNYNGHGGPSGWAEEQILTLGDIAGWRNLDNMPLLLTATCEFGRYDNPNVTSGAELTLLSAQGGAIGLLTTTRPVFASTNFLLNKAFFNTVFEPINGQMPRLGDIMIRTKNNSFSDVINRNFALLGDPSMRLAYPRQTLTLTQVNNRPIQNAAPLRALERVQIEGQISDPTFEGTVWITVTDKPRRRTIRSNQGDRFSYAEFDNRLFEGRASVRAGKFSASFVIPKDIDYQIGKGRVFLYAIAKDSTSDAVGVWEPLIGGSTELQVDNTPPQLRAYWNDASFKEGDEIAPQAVLHVELADDNGLNLSVAGLGHEMLATLDDSIEVVLNPFFLNDLDDFRKGKIRYLWPDLALGEHILRIKVWDNYNNPAEVSLRFRVGLPTQKPVSILAYPNPFSDVVQIQIEHPLPGKELIGRGQIFDALGRLLGEETHIFLAEDTLVRWQWSPSKWTGITQGMYFYHIFVESAEGTFRTQGSTKLLWKPQ